MKRLTWIFLVLALCVSLTPVICLADMADDLSAAIYDDDIQKVKELIAQGADVNARSSEYHGRTALENALTTIEIDGYPNGVAIALLLIDKDADVNAKDEIGWTPLLDVAFNDVSIEIAKALLDKGADINATDPNGWTALMKAAYGDHYEMARFLINQGADIHAETKKGATALYFAEALRHNDIAQLLYQAGANPAEGYRGYDQPAASATQVYSKGYEYYNQKKYDDAIVEFSKAIGLNPNYTDAYYSRGLVYYSKGNYDQAISDFSKAIGLDPNYGVAYYYRAVTYCYRLKEYDKAWDDVHKAESLGFIDVDFLEYLKKASGRDK